MFFFRAKVLRADHGGNTVIDTRLEHQIERRKGIGKHVGDLRIVVLIDERRRAVHALALHDGIAGLHPPPGIPILEVEDFR